MATEAKLVIDFGNSATRFNVVFDDGSGHHFKKYHSVTNTYARLPEGYIIPERYRTPENAYIEYAGDVYAHGDIVENEFSKSLIRPTTTEKKYSSQSTDLAVRYALFVGTKDIANFLGKGGNEAELSQDLVWKIMVLLPPNDVANGRDVIRKKFADIGSVQVEQSDSDGAITKGILLKTTVEKVGVVPEGAAACIAALFESSSKFNKGIDAEIVNSMILVIDIGSGTTDVCVVKGGKLVSSSMDTIGYGGRDVQGGVDRLLRSDAEIGGEYPEDVIAEAVKTGRIKIGPKRSIDIKDYVSQAKDAVAQKINFGATRYLEGTDYAANQISFVLPVGGGSIASEGLDPLSKYVWNYVHRLAKYSDLLPTPEGVSPRDLNVLGATIMAEKF